jgi:hypothetical protein
MVSISMYSSGPCCPAPPTPNATAAMPRPGVEPSVAGAVLVQKVGRVALTLRGSPQLLDLRPVVVGVLRRVDPVDGNGHAGLAVGLEPLHRKTRTDEIDDGLHSTP